MEFRRIIAFEAGTGTGDVGEIAGKITANLFEIQDFTPALTHIASSCYRPERTMTFWLTADVENEEVAAKAVTYWLYLAVYLANENIRNMGPFRQTAEMAAAE